MKVADLFVDLKLDTSGFTSDLNRALSTATRAANDITVDVKADTSKLGKQTSTAADKAGKDAGKKFGSGFSGAMKGAIGIAAGLGIASAGVGLIKGAMAEARDAQKTAAQTNAVIKSTGGIAKVTAKDVDTLATAISKKTGIDDEQIAASENMLLTFTNVRNAAGKNNDVFNQATKVVTDMAAATGGDAVKSSVMLGKALNDPAKGISALSRVGVTFTEQQKKSIKAMQDQGNMAGAQKVILGELKKEFGGSAEAQATAADKAKVAWGNFQETLGTAVMPTVDKLLNLFTNKLLPGLLRTGTFIGKEVLPRFKEFGSYLQANIFPIIGTIAGVITSTIIPALTKLITTLYSWRDVLIPLAAGIGAIVLALKAYSLYTTIITSLTKAWAAVQAAFNVIMAANPIGIVVLALIGLGVALVVAYKRSETFRNVVNAAWAGIKTAIAAAWNFIKPIFAAIGQWIVGSLIPFFKRLWSYVQAAMRGIAAAVTWAWNNVIKPIFNLYKAYIVNIVIPALRLLWNIAKAVFKGVSAALSAAWNGIIKPVFNAIRSVINGVVLPIFRALLSVARSVFSSVGSVIRAAWTGVISPVFTALKSGVGKVKDAFTTAINGIKTIWGKLESAAKTPVRFVVNTVFGGLANAVNKIPGVNIPVPHVSFASGGVLPGYTPGRDVHRFVSPTGGVLNLSGGEGIMRPEWVKEVGGPKAIAAMNNNARGRGRHQDFAGGGLYRPLKGGTITQGLHDQYTGYPSIDFGVGSGTPVYAGASGRVSTSVDLATSYGHYIKVMHAGFSTLYAHLDRRLAQVGQAVKGGQQIGTSDNTGHSTGPHLHFGAKGISPYAFLGGSQSYTGSKGGGDQGLIDKAKALLSVVKDMPGKVKGFIDDIKNMSSSGIGSLVKDAAKGVGNKIVDLINDKIPDKVAIPFAPDIDLPDNPIPGFAKGGIVKKRKGGKVVRVGEGKSHEAIIPLRNLYGDIKKAFDGTKMAARLSAFAKKYLKGATEKATLKRITGLVAIQKKLAALSSAQGKLASLKSQRADTVKAIGENIAPNIGDYASEPGGIAAGLHAKVAQVGKFVTVLKALKKAGYPIGLIRQVAGLGLVDGVNAGNQLLSADKATKAQLTKDFNTLSAAAGGGGVAGSLGNLLFGDQIAAQQKLVNKMKSSKELHKQMENLGASIVKGMAKTLHISLKAPKKKKASSGGGKNSSSGGSPGGGGKPGGGGSPGGGSPKEIARRALNARGWGNQWAALNQLVQHESSWNPHAQNPSSSAYGLFQFLNSTWATVGAKKTSSPAGQISAGLKYIKQRYGSPNKAWSFWQKHHWYDQGGWLDVGRQMTVNNTGKPEAVLTSGQWQQLDRLISAVERGRGGPSAPLIGHADIHSTVDLEKYERQRAFRDRSTRI